jgi:protein phosphatase
LLVLDHFGLTDAGKVRQNNEDSLLVGEGRDPSLFAVADGIGGFEAGEVASSIAVDVLKELGPGDSVERAIQEANRRVLERAREDQKLSGMGTTVVVARFTGTGEEATAEVSHVGDSRAYLLRDGELRPLTEDHSLVAELVRSGSLTREQASEHPQKNLITRALGAEEEVEVDTTRLPLEAGDRILLCSDGLSDMVAETRIKDILSTEGAQRETETVVRELVSKALEAGGADNVTVVAVDVREESHKRASRGDDTREMLAISGEGTAESPGEPASQDGRASSKRAARRERRSRKSGRVRRFAGLLSRFLAVVLLVAALATPVYLWLDSRYFLGFEDGEVVLYNGVPYDVMGYELNEEVRRTGLEDSDIGEPYQEPIRNHRLYTEERVEEVLRGLEES